MEVNQELHIGNLKSSVSNSRKRLLAVIRLDRVPDLRKYRLNDRSQPVVGSFEKVPTTRPQNAIDWSRASRVQIAAPAISLSQVLLSVLFRHQAI